MRKIADILKKSIKLLVKVKNVSFILQKKTKWTFWPSQYLHPTSNAAVEENQVVDINKNCLN